MKTAYQPPRIQSAKAFRFTGLKRIYNKPGILELRFARRRHVFPGEYSRYKRTDRNPLQDHGAE